MSRPISDRVFEPFFPTKASGKAVGLGFWVAHGIVAQMGDVILVKTGVGFGATFDVYLPEAPVKPGHAVPGPTGRTIGPAI